MREKIRYTKGNIGRGTSKLELEIVNKWYQFLLCEFSKEFDARTNASFGKVGQTARVPSRAGGGVRGEQQVGQAPEYINNDT